MLEIKIDDKVIKIEIDKAKAISRLLYENEIFVACRYIFNCL